MSRSGATEKGRSMKKACYFGCVVLVLAFATVPAVVAQEGGSEDTEMTWGGFATAQVDDPVVPFYAGPAEDAYLRRAPDHPPIDQIPPMPMPPAWEGPESGLKDGHPVVYNALTGETTALPATESTGASFGFGGGSPGLYDDNFSNEEDFYSETFGTMTDVTGSAGINPWNKNAKLVMKFTTTTGGTAWYVCSGSMQDPEVVLTAGHCVFNRDANIMAFADEIWVYPGWDGVGSTGTSTTIENYGFAVSNYYAAWSDWTGSGSTTHDLGWVRLNRAVGVLTGDWGWAYGQSCATIQSRTSWNSSYPAENCPDVGYHNGRRLFQWGGTVDDCDTTNKLHLITAGGCFDALWGGSSGSAMYYVDTNRYVLGVASTSDRVSNAYYARFWLDGVNYMNDTFIPLSRGTDLDLQMLDFRADQSAITAGNSVTNASFVIANPTNATAPVTNWGLEVRLSTNEILSTLDTLVQDTFVQRAFSAMQSYTVTFSTQPMIPYNTPSGSYWLGVILDPGSDASTNGNYTDYWDAHPITVTGVADVSADYLIAPNGTFSAGDPLNLTYNIDNLGGDPSNSINVEIRASTNTTISAADPLVASYTLGGLSGNGTTTQNPTVNLPWTLSGTYYIGMIISSSDDVNSSNNTTYDAVPINVIGTLFYDGFESGNTTAWSSVHP